MIYDRDAIDAKFDSHIFFSDSEYEPPHASHKRLPKHSACWLARSIQYSFERSLKKKYAFLSILPPRDLTKRCN